MTQGNPKGLIYYSKELASILLKEISVLNCNSKIGYCTSFKFYFSLTVWNECRLRKSLGERDSTIQFPEVSGGEILEATSEET